MYAASESFLLITHCHITFLTLSCSWNPVPLTNGCDSMELFGVNRHNHKRCEWMILRQQIWKSRELTHLSIVYPATTVNNVVVIQK